jgi:hypothetical protein
MRMPLPLSRHARHLHTAGLVAAASLLARPAAAQAPIDHAPFTALLSRHVVDGMVDYDAFKADPSFNRYLESLDRARPDALDEPDQLAFWINVYNAYTIALINRHGERQSIRNINKSLGVLRLKGPWSEPIVRAAGRVLTLDDVEHGIIRKRFAEPRIHFALVCAAMGCPPLRSEAYTGADLERQLEDQAQRFLRQSPEKNRIDVQRRRVHLSPIFSYYRKDFGGGQKELGAFLADYFPEEPVRKMLESGAFRIIDTEYDWTLNSQENARAAKGSHPPAP